MLESGLYEAFINDELEKELLDKGERQKYIKQVDNSALSDKLSRYLFSQSKKVSTMPGIRLKSQTTSSHLSKRRQT